MDTVLSNKVVQQRKKKRIYTASAIILAVVVCVWLVRFSFASTIRSAAFRTAKVEVGSIENTLSASGQILPEFEEVITSPITASIQNVMLDAGSQVKAGQAILTLDNGKTIDLSSDASGLLATEGSVQVKKVQAGKLVYSEDGSAGADKTKPGGTASASHINTLSTPRGGKYMAVLPDGTKVWLNAASSISFPTRFAKDTRMVSMSGEAYFEVAKEPSRPFIVKTGSNLQVRVYGTHFNINDFGPKGRCKTTLLEGSVSVTRGDDSLRLKPGQQAVATTRGKVVLNRHVDLSEVIGWKNDLFYFKQEGIHGIMNRISLWYDVDIRYQGPLPTDKFSAIISRDKSLSELLSILKEAGKVDFQVQGRTVVVSRRAGI